MSSVIISNKRNIVYLCINNGFHKVLAQKRISIKMYGGAGNGSLPMK